MNEKHALFQCVVFNLFNSLLFSSLPCFFVYAYRWQTYITEYSVILFAIHGPHLNTYAPFDFIPSCLLFESGAFAEARSLVFWLNK